MTSVVLNGNTYSDTGSPTGRDLCGSDNYGHTRWLLPMLSDTMTDIGARQSAIATAVSQALAHRDAAAASALSAVNAPGTNATSATSLAMGSGSKTLTIQTGKALVVGQFVVIAVTATPTTYMVGQVTAYNTTNGSLTVSVSLSIGTGTFAAWTVSLAPASLREATQAEAEAGTVVDAIMTPDRVAQAIAAIPSRIVYSPRSAAATLAAADCGRLIDITTGTFTLSFSAVSTLGAGWWCYVRNTGAGTIALDPASTETIDGGATLSLYGGETRLIYSAGAALQSILLVGVPVMYLTEEYASGTNGTAFTSDTWKTRPINTVKLNRIAGASLSAGLITLPAGTYEISASYALESSGSGSTKWLTRLFNQTAAAVLCNGVMLPWMNVQISTMVGVFTLTANSVIRLEHYAGGGYGNGGLPYSIPSTNEVYANITIRKLS